MAIKIYRKESTNATRKPTKATVAETRDRVAALARVQRPELLDFILSGEFHKLPALPSATIRNAALREYDYADAGWTVPDGSLGRGGVADASQAQSIVLWLKKNLGDVVASDEVSVVLTDD